ncbi:hypothetical protein AVEN_141007-1 [Araneus ventricosus]|uniref:Pre-C2HC domain-containing protein n=1 Tax=Araneus ventricosus TaxID=182803 RepID=A0A4Y2L5L9_ARAVE|nr:hypothetical protein AVEN_141007-1 [Araneus ventricosus]
MVVGLGIKASSQTKRGRSRSTFSDNSGRSTPNPVKKLKGNSTPSFWAGSQISLNSSLGSPPDTDNICGSLLEKDSQWRALNAKLLHYLDQIDLMYKNDQGNSPECIQLSIERKNSQDKIELIEDEIMRLGPCPNVGCLAHHDKVRSTSPNDSFKLVSKRHAAKIKDKVEKPEISTENKFQTFMGIDNDIENNLKIDDNMKQIPAINLKLETNYNLTLQEINRMYPDTEEKLINGFISIQTTNPENRERIIEYFKKNDKEFILSEAYADRPLKTVIKGLPLDQNKDELKSILENKDFKILRISKLKNCRLKTLHPYFLIEAAKTKNHLSIYNLQIIKLLRVKIEPYRN